MMMKHHILAKFNEQADDKEKLIREIESLFLGAGQIPGVQGARVYPNCVDRKNRYDVMIVVEMEKAALENWDESPLHHQWKERYGHLLAAKAIFDCE